MRSEKLLVAGGFVLISLIWGSTWLAIKVGLDSVPPCYGVAIRFTVAITILLVILRIRREKFVSDQASILSYTALGVLSFSFPFALVYWSEQHIASGLASILFAVYPFVVAIGSHLFIPSEPLTLPKIIGIILGFTGIVVIFWSDIHIGGTATLAMGAILLSTIMQGTSLIIIKRISTHLSPIILTLGGMIIGTIIMYLMAFLFEDFSEIKLDDKGLGSILYLGTLGTVVTFIVYFWLLKRVQVVYLSLVSLVTPVLAVILGTVFLDEKLSPRVFTGAGLVLIGILIANGKDLLETFHTQKNHFLAKF
ncbi:MAG: DMT family transporter [Ignavibacteriae bacterium]|nr:DMT family transporter [Ignavibacteriota bacterium]